MKKIILVFIFSFVAVSAFGQNAARRDCFPFERLAPAERRKAEELLLKALDSEALYTIAGNLKPMSSGFRSFQLAAREPRGITPAEAAALAEKYPSEEARKNLSDEEKRKWQTAEAFLKRRDVLRELEETRRILALWRCGDDSFFADVQHFQKTFEGTRFAETVVFNKKALRETIAARADFFSRWGITPASHPLQVLYAVEADETGARFGGYGYLFGYPDYAVNFFVAAAAEEEFTGRFVERGFYSIETFARPTNGFVWATPKNHAETEADRALKLRAAQILADYKRRRAEYIGEGKRGVVEMLRDWLL